MVSVAEHRARQTQEMAVTVALAQSAQGKQEETAEAGMLLFTANVLMS